MVLNGKLNPNFHNWYHGVRIHLLSLARIVYCAFMMHLFIRATGLSRIVLGRFQFRQFFFWYNGDGVSLQHVHEWFNDASNSLPYFAARNWMLTVTSYMLPKLITNTCMFVRLGVFIEFEIFHTHMETWPWPKEYKIWPILTSRGQRAARVINI